MPVEFQYSPRPQFVQFHQRHQRNALMVCHRRLGKTVACIGDLVVRALHTAKSDARYGYVAPFRQQAKEIAWVYLKNMTEGIRTESPRESELRIKLPNGAWVTLYGADNPDALRGLYFDGLILDEFGDMKPSLMGEVVLPCLADRNGFLVLIGTAKGRNQFHKYKIMAENSNDWFYKMAKASETQQIPADELQRLRDTMTEAQYEQEMECSFDAALAGTFYADMINRLDQKGQLIHDSTLYEPTQKVHVAADVGLRDSTAWWFWQPRPEGIAVIDHYEASGRYIDHYLGMLHDKQYDYHEIWLPHDAKAKTLATRRSTVEQFAAPGSVRPDIYGPSDRLPIRIVPKMAIQHGIDAVRLILPTCHFDYNNTAQGLDALRSYRRQYHEHVQQFSNTPLHDWSSNSADAFRYLALVAKESIPHTSDTPQVTRLPDGSMLGRNGQPTAGYCLDDLFKDRERHKGKVIRL
jgi:hypothetical protein